MRFALKCRRARPVPTGAKKERMVKYRIFATLVALAPACASAQSSYPLQDGIDRAPAAAIVIPDSSGVATPPSLSNPLVVGTVPQGVNFSSCIGTITATNVPQLVVAANPNRHYLVIDNQTTTQMSLGLNATVTLTTGIPVYTGGGGYEWASEVPTNTIYIVGTAGNQYVCWQG